MRVALVHDYLTQRGGAERVLLSMLKAFPQAPVYTSMYNPATTFPAFRDADVRTLPLDRIPGLRRRHRAAFPLLAPAFSKLRIDADVVICSSSGWAHGVRTTGRKIVLCYTPARWLYQTDRYLGGRSPLLRGGLALARPYLERWDRKAALSADLYLAISTVVKDRITTQYGIDADLVWPPQTLSPDGPQQQPPGLPQRFYLCVSRLLPYKNVDALLSAFRSLPGEQLVVAGAGPERERLEASAPSNVHFIGTASDAQLRWLYANSAGLLAPSYEDFGLTTIEAAAFGKPSAALRWGGFLDTVREGVTGILFDKPEPRLVAEAVRSLCSASFHQEKIKSHAAQFSETAFVARLRQIATDSERAPFQSRPGQDAGRSRRS